MQFKRLKIKNFMSYKNADIELTTGLYLIDGFNRDKNTHNGSGKSVLVDAICFGLFGLTARNIVIDDVINRDFEKGCEVELEIDNYRIFRSRKPNGLEFYHNNIPIQGKDAVETQRFIEGKLGITYDLFKSAVYFSQNQYVYFVTANDNTKKEILTQLLNLEIFDNIHEYLKQELNSKETFMLLTKQEISQNAKQLQIYQNQIDDNEELERNWDKDKEKRIDRIREQMLDIGEQIQKKSELEVKLKIECEDLSAKIKENEDALSSFERLLKDINEQIINKNNRVDAENLTSSIASLENNKKNMEIGIRQLAEKIKQIDLKREGNCEVCYQPINGLLLDDNKNKMLLACNEMLAGREAIAVQIEDMKLIKQKAEIQHQEEIKQLKKDRDTISSDMNIKQQERILNEKRLASNYRNIESIKESIVSFYKEIERKEKMIEDIQTETNVAMLIIVQLREKYAQTEKAIRDKEEKLKENSQNMAIDGFLREAFSNKGIKAYVFEQVVQEINFNTNEYLAYLFDTDTQIEFKTTETKNKKGEVSHKFETNLAINGRTIDFNTLSGGEKRRVILAVDLAISKIIQNRKSKNFSLLIYDEYFDGLDTSGKEKVMELLQSVEDTTILVIDHASEFKQLFDHNIEVIKENGISSIA